ncbi:MAG TPA: class I SAM-dependent methyltransferase [Polyangiaceae bacterium]|jgi:demethylmenaquinone methyltransferase/2-methoxy-6-polyprenyl-1,4-benzoquinol methylase|nr:MAG: Demethylmenaquinone methyltransferase [Deltaproteobacteria bacterium ADurb.Bin207]HNS99989.1 class I SAM-dependent methyltransferase [Polyangiaceae bacterium]HNZ23745.1 class I SAM-dependent methyltransferase [Polyangiaceae bacterium]HOD23062.1 class I SAM-dependent methyltransferase [Polyangiaceae bacterium]HOE48970.1 class I SAM-dependent methyltransferase [Polyangiaceae bacterium]
MHSKVEFFNNIAELWDGWEDRDALGCVMKAGLQKMEISSHEIILDVGCGTGNLTQALLGRLGPGAKVAAIDISPRMVEVAKTKVRDGRVSWQVADACQTPFSSNYFDRIFCFSVWPHFDDPKATALELRRVLRPLGRLHIWHHIGRDKVNEIHATASPAVSRDILLPAQDLAALLLEWGFDVLEAEETENHYLISAQKPEKTGEC